jgi:hypothetical protein
MSLMFFMLNGLFIVIIFTLQVRVWNNILKDLTHYNVGAVPPSACRNRDNKVQNCRFFLRFLHLSFRLYIYWCEEMYKKTRAFRWVKRGRVYQHLFWYIPNTVFSVVLQRLTLFKIWQNWYLLHSWTFFYIKSMFWYAYVQTHSHFSKYSFLINIWFISKTRTEY